MRIVHVSHAFPPFSRAGSENYVEALALEQMRRHQVSVFHRVDDPERPEYELWEARHGEIEVMRINRTFRDLRRFRETYRSDAVASRFRSFLEESRPDVVHFHHTTCLSTTCVHEAKRLGLPVVYTLHDFWLLCPRGQLLRRDLSLCESHTDGDCVRCMAYQLSIRGGHARLRQLSRRAARLARLRFARRLHRHLVVRPFAREPQALAEIRERTAHVREMCGLVDRFVSPSRFLKERYVEFGIPESCIEVRDNGFDLSSWLARRPEPRGRDSRLRVVYLGTWIPSKGVHVLLEAFRELDPSRAMLEVHGYAVPYDGFEDYEGHLRRIAAGAPHIRFVGPYEPGDVPKILAAADVLVAPSIWYENSPLTVHEAFLAGVPVLASDHGGLREYVEHGKNGLTFRAGDAAALRAQLQRLTQEPGLLRRLQASRTHVVGIESHAAELEALYQALQRQS